MHLPFTINKKYAEIFYIFSYTTILSFLDKLEEKSDKNLSTENFIETIKEDLKKTKERIRQCHLQYIAFGKIYFNVFKHLIENDTENTERITKIRFFLEHKAPNVVYPKK